MRIDIATIFPGMFAGPLGVSIVARAQETGAMSIRVHDLRDYSEDRHRTVDDTPYGGGAGMVMRATPFFGLYEQLTLEQVSPAGDSGVPGPRVVLFSPGGEVLTQSTVRRLANEPWLLLLCGHYEGVDERVSVALHAEEISLGDFVLTGGELPAMVLVDAVARQLPGVLGTSESLAEESFSGSTGRLEYPQYTRPPEIKGFAVPDVLRSGDHGAIRRWRAEQSLLRTAARRPDLIRPEDLTAEEQELLRRQR